MQKKCFGSLPAIVWMLLVRAAAAAAFSTGGCGSDGQPTEDMGDCNPIPVVAGGMSECELQRRESIESWPTIDVDGKKCPRDPKKIPHTDVQVWACVQVAACKVEGATPSCDSVDRCLGVDALVLQESSDEHPDCYARRLTGCDFKRCVFDTSAGKQGP